MAPGPQDAAQQAEQGRSTTTTAVLISTAAALGGFLFGYDTAVINGAVDAVQSRFELSPLLIGFTVSCALLGAAVGAWFAGPVADKVGRTRVMVGAAALFTVSALGSGLCFTVWDLILWRFVGGVGVGVASVIAPAYIAEISPAHLRGRLGSLQQMAIVSGIFIALLSNAFLADVAGGASEQLALGLAAWRWMFLAELLPAVLYGVLALTIPESPRYLVAKGDEDEAAGVLRRVLGTARVKERVAEIKRTLAREDQPSMRDLRGPALGLLPIVWVGILLSAFQQLVGINVVFYYSTSLWRSVGFDEGDAFTTSVITSVVNVLVTIVAITLIDKVGRRVLLLVGSAGMAVCLALLALAFSNAGGSVDDPTLPAPWDMTALVAFNAFVVFFGVSWGPAVWVLLGEMFSNRIRAAALAVAAAAQWIANFAVSTSFPRLSESLGLGTTYAIYTTFAAISFFFVLRYVPEPRGKELEDMDETVDLRDLRRAAKSSR